MMKKICAFLSILIMAVTFVAPGANAAATNLPMGDIGDYGTWATENNRQIITNNLKTDLYSVRYKFENDDSDLKTKFENFLKK